MKKISTNERLQQITEQLQVGVKEVFTSEKFLEYLRVMSRFTNYSVNNQLLILLQHPTAQHVAGYKSWETNFSRHVRHGEKAIYILAPVTRLVEKEVVLADGTIEMKEDKVTTYKPVPVFADDQTEGEDLPTICEKLTDNVDGFLDLLDKLEKVAPVPISYEAIEGGANGFFSLTDEKIVIQYDLPELHKCKTVLHETAHAMLHCKDGDEEMVDRQTAEVEAEAVAYTVASYLGLDTSGYSFAYIAGWAGNREVEQLKRSLDIIRRTANTIIEGIEAA